jgi:deltex-like protein
LTPHRPWASLDSDIEEEDADAALARQLQEQEWASPLSKQDGGSPMSIDSLSPTQDATLAAALDMNDDDLNQLSMQSDASLAAQLQQEEHEHKNQRVQAEHHAMSESLDGRAWLFVNQVLDLHKRLSTTVAPEPQTVAVDDMVFLGKNFLQCIQEFEQNAWPAHVTLAYHYTRSNRMDSIKQDGLMTLADRKKAYNISHGVGVFGDGVYTATNPFAFRRFGDVGLLVAIIQGHATRVPFDTRAIQDMPRINTKIGNKALIQINGQITDAIKYTDELVLRESKQCLPLMRFDTAYVSSQTGQDAVWMYHQELQKLLDSTFNKGVPTILTRIHESSTDPHRTGGAAAAHAAFVLATSRARHAAAASRAASLSAAAAAVVSNAASRSAAAAAALSLNAPATNTSSMTVVFGSGGVPAPANAGPQIPSSQFAATATIGHATASAFPAPGVAGASQVGPIMQRSRSRRTASKSTSSGFLFSGSNSAATTGGVVAASAFPAPGVPGASPFGPTMQRSSSSRTASKSTSSGLLFSGSNSVATTGGVLFASAFPAPGVPGASPFGPTMQRSRSHRTSSKAAGSSQPFPGSYPCSSGHSARNQTAIQYIAPLTLSASSTADAFVNCSKGSKEYCVICMESLANGGQIVSLKHCGHEYHKQCIEGALKSSNKCPVCRTLISKPQGHCPSGTMRISYSNSIRCGGFDNCGSIIISYEIPSGIQSSFHENPGQQYHGTNRNAYLPDNEEGRELLDRLVFAWNHGLTFTVGTSLTTGQPNCVTWTSIHHKTSPRGGHHGFPDQGYFLNAHGELDSAGVPK